MPKQVKTLTAAAVVRLRMPGRYAVGGVAGLHLRIRASGSRAWVLRLLLAGQRCDLTLGRTDGLALSQAALLRRAASPPRLGRGGASPDAALASLRPTIALPCPLHQRPCCIRLPHVRRL